MEDESNLRFSGQSQTLRAAVELMMSSPFPMFILIGPSQTLVYNQAYIPILGAKHPKALGRPFFAIWPEVEAEISPIIEKAYAGQATHLAELAVTLARPNPETAWFNFAYSPIRDESTSVVGVLCICQETTSSVRLSRRQDFLIKLEWELRELEDAGQIISTAQQALGKHLGVSRVGYGSVDNTERFFTTEGNWTDGSVPGHNGTHDLAAFGGEIFSALRRGIPLVVDDTLTDPRARDPGAAAAFAALQVRSAATVSLIKGGRFVAALYVHHHQPRQWSADDAALVHDVAERTWSAVERSHAQERLRRLSERQAFLLELSDALRPLAQPVEITALAAQMLGRHLKAGRVGYGEIDQTQNFVSVERDWSDATMSSLGGETRHLDVFGPEIIGQLRQGHVLRLASIAEDSVSAPYAAGYESIGTKALIVVPLLKAGRFVAIFFVHHSEPRRWNDEDVALTAEVAERTWAAVERARAEGAIHELNRTLEQRVAEALAEKRLYADLVELTDSPIQIIDRDFRFLAINPAAQGDYESIYGVRPEIGSSLKDLLAHSPEQLDAAVSAWSRALNGEIYDQRQWWGAEERSKRAYDTQFRPLRDGNNQIVGAYLLGRDVTELLREQERLAAAEEQLRQSQKMEAIGQLTGGVAHDFNNLLTPIVGSLSILQSKNLGGEREQRMIARAMEAAERARILVQRLLAFARRQPLKPEPVDIGHLVRDVAALIGSTVGPQISVKLDIEESLSPAMVDANQLEMALINLAVNARDAMPDGGTLRISASAADARRFSSSKLAAGSYIRLSVADTGTGMDQATLKRATEPFFSTKGVGKGTGLGLSMVHGLALQLGGTLTIESQPGMGTNVEMWLPASDDQPSVAKEKRPEVETRREGSVLLVDDEDVVRANTAELLRDLGYNVKEAASGAEAIQLMRGGFEPDFLITDHLMPGMSGTDLARTLLAEHPSLLILIISGYSAVDDIAPDLPRLAKPFRNDELSSALIRLSQRGSASTKC